MTEAASTDTPSPRLGGVVTRAAWFTGLLAVSSGVGFLLLGWEELLIASVFLAAILVVAPVFLLGGQNVEARLDVGNRRVVVGQPAVGRILVRNLSRRRLWPARIEWFVGGTRSAFALPSVVGRGQRELPIDLPTDRRGVFDIGPISIVRTDPLALFRTERRLSGPQVLYVHPATTRVGAEATGSIRDLEGRAVRELTDSDLAFHALRDYEIGDDRRYIHWKATARIGSMMVRQFEQTRRTHILVLLSTRRGDYATPADFETAISVVGSFGMQSLSAGQTISYATSAGIQRSASGRHLLDALAEARLSSDAPSLVDIVRRLSHEVRQASAVVVACGDAVQIDHVQRLRHHLPSGLRTVLVRCGRDALAQHYRRGDVDLVTLPSLDELNAVTKVLR